MKHIVNKLFVVTMLLSVGTMSAGHTSGRSFFMPVANNGTAVNTLGWSGGIHKFDMDTIYGCFKVQSEYGQNTKKDEVGKYLLMNGKNSAIWGPEDAAGTTNDTDVAAINFLLQGITFKETVTFLPKAQDFVTNFGLFVGLDEWLEGMYLSVNAPLQHARWEVEMTKVTNTAAGATTFADSKMQVTGTTPTIPYSGVIAAFKGDKTVTAGDATVKWSYGRIDGRRTETKLGDVRATLGYNFINKETCHFGVGVQGLFGAGGKSKAEYVFAPVIGNSGRHGVGGVVDGAVRLWDKDEDHNLTAFLNASAVHLFDNEQVRNYDITNCGDWSRYLLVKKMTAVSGGNATYDGILDNMINIGALKAKIGVDVVYDANLTFCYQMGNMSVDFGYQLSGHGKEKHKDWVTNVAANTYTLYDYSSADCNSAAGVTQITISGNETGQTVDALIAAAEYDASFVSSARLNKTSGLSPAALEHCVFGGLNYNWMDSDWAPGIGVFGSYHISGDDNHSFDRWSVGFQGNVSF
jgi:hypothetical protein